MSNKEYKRFLRVGLGGINCACCGPAPGKERKRALRSAKRRERAEMKKEIFQELGK